MTNEQLETLAIKCALGNNGGEWATHYKEEHKIFWRSFVLSIESLVIDAVWDEARAEGYQDGWRVAQELTGSDA